MADKTAGKEGPRRKRGKRQVYDAFGVGSKGKIWPEAREEKRGGRYWTRRRLLFVCLTRIMYVTHSIWHEDILE